MADDIAIRLTITESGLSNLDRAISSLDKLNRRAAMASASFEKAMKSLDNPVDVKLDGAVSEFERLRKEINLTGREYERTAKRFGTPINPRTGSPRTPNAPTQADLPAQGGGSALGGIIAGAGAAATVLGTVGTAAAAVKQLNDMGVASLRAKAALDALTQGQANAYFESMRAGTKGLIADIDLAGAAVKALTLNVISNKEQAADLARAGAILGTTMGQGAKQGIETLTVALTRVNQTELLDNIGLEAIKIRKRFEELKKTMSDDKAWSMAVLENANEKTKTLNKTLEGTGTALERLGVKFSNAASQIGEGVATVLDKAITSTEQLIFILDNLNKLKTPLQSSTLSTIATVQQGQTRTGGYSRAYQQPAFAGGYRGTGSWESAYTGYQAYTNRAISQSEQAYIMANIGRGQRTGGGSFNATLFAGGVGGLDQGMTKSEKAVRSATKANNEYLDTLKAQKALSDGVKGGISGLTDAYNKFAQAADRTNKIQAKRDSVQSVAGAFGIKGDGLYSEMGSRLASTFEQKRTQYEQELRKKIGTGVNTQYAGAAFVKKFDQQTAERRAKAEAELRKQELTGKDLYLGTDVVKSGLAKFDAQAAKDREKELTQKTGRAYTQKDYKRDLEIFDATQQRALDAYAIATGQATRESLKFRDVSKMLDDSFLKGRTSTEAYTRKMYELSESLKNGTLSMSQMSALQRQLQQEQVIADREAQKRRVSEFQYNKTKPVRQVFEGAQDALTGVAGFIESAGKPAAVADPFAGITNSATTLTSFFQGMPALASGAGSSISSAFAQPNSVVTELSNSLASVKNAIDGLNGKEIKLKVKLDLPFGGTLG